VVARLGAAIRGSLREPDVRALFDSTGTILWDQADAAGLWRRRSPKCAI
jgi:hypothetical protein